MGLALATQPPADVHEPARATKLYGSKVEMSDEMWTIVRSLATKFGLKPSAVVATIVQDHLWAAREDPDVKTALVRALGDVSAERLRAAAHVPGRGVPSGAIHRS